METSLGFIENDVLSSILAGYQLRTHVFANPRLCGQWRLSSDDDPSGMASFHVLAEGHAWLHMKNAAPRRLERGDLLIVPRNDWHLLTPRASVAPTRFGLQQADGAELTWLICGHLEFLTGNAQPFIDALPAALAITAAEMDDRAAQLARMMMQELERPQPGGSALLDKLGEALFVLSVRHYIQRTADAPGLLGALRDPRLAQALAAIHAHPERDWTLASLARSAAMSRTSFAETFNRIVGIPPIEYLTRWRMTQAERLLTNPRLTINAVAEKVGYGSVESFRRAFKRLQGRSPSAVKRFQTTAD